LNLAYQLAERGNPAAMPSAAGASDENAPTNGRDRSVDIDALLRRVDAALGDDGQLL
jgi:cell division protein ZapA